MLSWERLSSSSTSQTLVRRLTVSQGTAMAVSLVVGSGVLGLPGIVLAEIGPEYSAVAWILTALAMIPFIIVFSRLGTSFPSSPGLLSYAELACGKTGKKAASLMLLTSAVIGYPALLMIGGAFLQTIFGLDPRWTPLLAIAILTLSVGLNLVGLQVTAGFNTFCVVILIAFIALLTVLKAHFFWEGFSLGAASLESALRDSRYHVASLWKGAALLFWAFLGWENLSFGVQEVKNPQRSVPLIFGLSYVLVTALFLMLAFTTIGAAKQGMTSVLGAAGLMALLDGTFLRPFCSAVLILLILGNANAWIYTSSRVLLALSQEGMLPRSLSVLSQKHFPVRCLLLCFFAVIISIGVCWIADFKIASLILLVNQNYLFLFLASIWAYGKLETSWSRFIVVPTALLTCSLFLSGFSAWILFPLALITGGWALSRREKS